MPTHLRPSSGWIGRLVLVLIGLVGMLGLVPSARAADDYSVALQTPDLIRQFEDVELTAVVKDKQGQPVNDLLVTFQVAPESSVRRTYGVSSPRR